MSRCQFPSTKLKTENVPKKTEKAKPSKQPSATQQAAEKIRHLIVSGELVADSNHLESELATRLGMSRTPVREATLTLQAAGLLEVQPRKGVKIKSISVNDIADIYQIITELECLAVKRAANSELKKADLINLSTAKDKMKTAVAEEDMEAWARADASFHSELVKLGGNEHLTSLISSMNDQVKRANAIALKMRPSPTRSNKDHDKL